MTIRQCCKRARHSCRSDDGHIADEFERLPPNHLLCRFHGLAALGGRATRPREDRSWAPASDRNPQWLAPSLKPLASFDSATSSVERHRAPLARPRAGPRRLPWKPRSSSRSAPAATASISIRAEGADSPRSTTAGCSRSPGAGRPRDAGRPWGQLTCRKFTDICLPRA